ncbi:hypothetical protein BTI52_08570, partial [Lactobacillus delbrueckii subsp. bulgaricus]|nr:hypothetical protein [Lactobacillus delbrueckii subsp. bulgaricus]
MARLPGSAQKAIKKRESSFRSFTSVLTACRMTRCTSTRLTLSENDAICIEDLDVKGMLMSHVASKGVHRALFGRFRSYLEYKCKSAGVKLVIA